MSDPRSIVDIARRHAECRARHPAYVILGGGETVTGRHDFAGIDRRARAVAVALRERNLDGQRVVISYPTSMEYVEGFLGCLYAGAVAVPCDAPASRASAQRLRSIRQDCRPALALRRAVDAGSPALDGIAGLDVADIPDELADGWTDPGIGPERLALLQYTSGSTRTPSGVMVRHGNILANEEAIRTACGNDEDSTFVGWLPLFHDMGLIANLLQPLYVGSTSVLMPPMAFLQAPIRWLRAISTWRAHTSGGPNFAYDLCVQRTVEEQRAGLDLTSWLVAYNGAEPVRISSMTRFTEAFARFGFASTAHFPCYGLAEATLLAAATPKAVAPRVLMVDVAAMRAGAIVPTRAATGIPVVSCGLPALGTDLRIVDPESGARLADGKIGEIWLRGPGITVGYWGSVQPSTFTARVAGTRTGPFLRTGDLGFLLDGEVHVTGRLRDLLVIRGQNHYPQDLEWCAESAHPAVRPSATVAFAVEVDGQQRLVLCLELRSYRGIPDVAAIAEQVRREVAAQQGVVPHVVAVLRRGGVPKTTSGKVRRRDCRQAYLDGVLPVYREVRLVATPGNLPGREELAVLDLDVAASVLADAMLRLLKVRTAGSAVQPATGEPLTSLGVDSMMATELMHRVQDAYSVPLDTAVVLGAGALEIAHHVLAVLDTPAEDGADPADAVCRAREWSPLTLTQRSLWFELEWESVGAAYHLARVLRVHGRLDAAALQEALTRLGERHPALRTRFALRDGQPQCRVLDAPLGSALEIADGAGVAERELLAGLAALADAPFELAQDLPLRMRLVLRRDHEHLLLVVVHHLVADFWTFVILLRELKELYAAATSGREAVLAPVRAGHVDLVRAERSYLDSERARRDSLYWRETLAGAADTLALPTRYPRPPVRSFQGTTRQFRFPAELVAQIAELAQTTNCTVFTVLLAGYRLLLHRYTGQPDVVVGTLLANRDDAAHAGVAGYLANPVPLRGSYSPRESFRELLSRTGASVREAMVHGRYPLERMVSELRLARSADRPTLMQTMFVLQREYGTQDDGFRAIALGADAELSFGDLRMEPVPLPRAWSQLDLSLTMAEVGAELVGSWEYRTDLFDDATVAGMGRHLARLLAAVAGDPDRPLGALNLLDTQERAAARARACGPSRTRELTESLAAMVIDQVGRGPEAIAVAATDGRGRAVQLSYAALDRFAGSVATALRELGVRPDEPVGVLHDRGVELPAAYLGVSYAGAAVLPLEVDQPDRRLAAMIADSGARLVLTQPALLDRARALAIRPLITSELAGHRCTSTVDTHPEQAAYLLYTSGSTGTPKGVSVPQRAIVNRIRWMQEEFGLRAGERVLHKTPIGFDVSLWELFWPLTTGGCLVVAAPGGHREPRYLLDVIEREQISVMHFVPTLLRHFLAEQVHRRNRQLPLRTVVCSGEALPPDLAERFFAQLDARLHNLYGPTEAAVDVTGWECQPGDRGPVPIGRPIVNSSCEVLDEYLLEVPEPVGGELYLSGACLARGYLGRPGLTAQSFLPAPGGTRRYRTGDLARWRPDAALDFLGRNDQQVKVGGNRVELEEVAGALRAQPGVLDAAVLKGTGTRADQLVGYVVRSGVQPEPATLRARLAQQLPGYMVPAVIVPLERMPVTANGKLDRAALPLPHPQPLTDTPPRTPTERALANVWSSQFELPSIGIDRTFFDLGGDSIQALRTVAAARELGWRLSVTDIIRSPTIRALAGHLDGLAQSGAASGPTQPFALCPEAAGLPGIEDAYPISLAQRVLLFHRGGNAGYESYLTSAEVSAVLDADRLTAAVRSLVQRHGYLRSTFDLTSYAQPVQLVHAVVDIPLTIVDLAGLPVDRQDDVLRQWLLSERTRHIDVERGPLVHLTAHDLGGRFRLTVTSFALDGWSDALVLTEVLQELFTGQTPTTPAGTYADFVACEQAALDCAEHRRFWAAELAGVQPCRINRSTSVRMAGAGLRKRWALEVDEPTGRGLAELAAGHGVGIKHVLLGVHLRIVRLLTGVADCVTGLHTNGRPDDFDGDHLIGVFNNILPLRMRVAGGSWAALARAAYATESRILEFRRFPLATMQREFRAADKFDLLFVYTHFHLYRTLAETTGVPIGELYAPDQTYVPLTAHFNKEARTGQLRLLLEYDPAEFADEHIAAIGACYRRALRAAATRGHHDYRDEDLVTDPAGIAVLPAGATVEQPSLAGLVAVAASRCPDHTALVTEDGQHTYAGLLGRAARLAGALREVGVRADTVVGVPAPRSSHAVLGILAVLMAGGAYLPLDPADPVPRLRHILRAAGATVVLVPPGTPTLEWADDCVVVAGNATGPPCPAPLVNPAQLACVLATSGSTGQPKVIGVPHRGMVNYVQWCVAEYGITQDTVSVVHTALGFDLTVTSLWGPLVAGGTAHLLGNGDPSALGAALRTGRHTLLKITPSHLLAVGEQLGSADARTALRTVVVGGEAMHAHHVHALRAIAPDALLVNEYGPTETVVGCCAGRVPGTVEAGAVPIGTAIAGCRLGVFDDDSAVPAEVTGELCVGGAGVTRGYLGQPARTAEVFRPEPGGERRYHTADRVRRLLTGELAYLGRRDGQVKIRGHRVEVGEAEHVLAGHPAVGNAVVVARPGPGDRVQLVGYWVAGAGPAPTTTELMRWLRGRLPNYLIPAYLLRLPALPTTTNGKIDRTRLPDRTHLLPELLDRIEEMTEREAVALLADKRVEPAVSTRGGVGSGGSR